MMTHCRSVSNVNCASVDTVMCGIMICAHTHSFERCQISFISAFLLSKRSTLDFTVSLLGALAHTYAQHSTSVTQRPWPQSPSFRRQQAPAQQALQVQRQEAVVQGALLFQRQAAPAQPGQQFLKDPRWFTRHARPQQLIPNAPPPQEGEQLGWGAEEAQRRKEAPPQAVGQKWQRHREESHRRQRLRQGHRYH